jgi:AGCS family alanine or glycine:cation symporter
MGSAPLIAAAARSQSPARQALIASTATFWDTVVMCLVSGLVIVSSLLSGGIPSDINFSGGELTALAFARIPHIGTPLLLFSIITFAYATILGWSYYGERCLEYLFGSRSFFAYRFLWILVLVFAPVLELELIWNISDTLNALMAIPNLTAVLLLSGEIAKESRNL